MNWPNFAVTNGQQAPAPARVQSAPSCPDQVALIKAHWTEVETASYAIQRPAIVSRVLVQLENRFWRSQPIGPVVERGGRIWATADSAAMSAILSPLSLDQRHMAVEPIHEARRRQAYRQEYAHRHQDHFDRLARLIEHGAREDAHKIRVADGDSQGRILSEVQKLARQGRDDDAEGLRDDHEPQHLTWG